MSVTAVDKKAPMPAAPMRYKEDGSVDWGNMWDTFCVLALDGGPPHRDQRLQATVPVKENHPQYQLASDEIIRGIYEVSRLRAQPLSPGWIGISCPEPGMAAWLKEAILEENVDAKIQDGWLCVPVSETFTMKSEIKSVITAVAKTSHYWQEHVPVEVKQALAMQAKWQGWKRRLTSWLHR